MRNFEGMVQEYRSSAERLEKRLGQLQAALKGNGPLRDLELERRIALLQSERYQLLRVAWYLENYQTVGEVW